MKTIIFHKDTVDDCVRQCVNGSILLKDRYPQGYRLLNLVNLVITKGWIPADLKANVIISISKVVFPTRPKDYRPINLPPMVDKILQIVAAINYLLFSKYF